jgi:hypothetical protein
MRKLQYGSVLPSRPMIGPVCGSLLIWATVNGSSEATRSYTTKTDWHTLSAQRQIYFSPIGLPRIASSF